MPDPLLIAKCDHDIVETMRRAQRAASSQRGRSITRVILGSLFGGRK